MANTGKITLTVTDFQPTTTPNYPSEDYCTVTLAITDFAQTAKKQSQIGPVAGDPLAIWMQSKNAQSNGLPGPVGLEITIAPADYVPTGKFQFIQTRQKNDPTGGQNFDSVVASGAKLTMSNNWVHRGHSKNSKSPNWEFFIQIKQVSTGQLGWIDPGFENADDL